MWGTLLSEPLPIVATVGYYPAVKLIGRIPIAYRTNPFVMIRCLLMTSSGIRLPFGRLFPCMRQVGYALLTHPPVVAHH